MIITLDQALLEKVRALLTPRRSKISQSIFAVNHQLGYGYPTWDEGEPQMLFTETEFHELTSNGQRPFEWAPGLVGNDMSPEEFRRTLEVAAAQAE